MSRFSPSTLSPQDWTQVVRMGSKYPLGHLAGLKLIIWNLAFWFREVSSSSGFLKGFLHLVLPQGQPVTRREGSQFSVLYSFISCSPTIFYILFASDYKCKIDLLCDLPMSSCEICFLRYRDVASAVVISVYLFINLYVRSLLSKTNAFVSSRSNKT